MKQVESSLKTISRLTRSNLTTKAVLIFSLLDPQHSAVSAHYVTCFPSLDWEFWTFGCKNIPSWASELSKLFQSKENKNCNTSHNVLRDPNWDTKESQKKFPLILKVVTGEWCMSHAYKELLDSKLSQSHTRLISLVLMCEKETERAGWLHETHPVEVPNMTSQKPLFRLTSLPLVHALKKVQSCRPCQISQSSLQREKIDVVLFPWSSKLMYGDLIVSENTTCVVF